MKLTTKQLQIMQHIEKYGSITKKEAVTILGRHYYYNASKHVGELLSRMVKSGHITREKRGTYVKPKGVHLSPDSKTLKMINPNQLNMFE